jgi:DNA-binding transcriptional regulator YiaG
MALLRELPELTSTLVIVLIKESPMPNLAAAIKEEITRLAKKEVKSQTGATKQAVAQYRRDIANLKRQVRKQEQKIAFLETQEKKRLEVPPSAEETSEGVRFSARSVKAQRVRLGLSAADYAKLVGVSSLTIYNWEQGKTRPRQEQLASLVAVRGIGKREALKRLELLS